MSNAHTASLPPRRTREAFGVCALAILSALLQFAATPLHAAEDLRARSAS